MTEPFDNLRRVAAKAAVPIPPPPPFPDTPELRRMVLAARREMRCRGSEVFAALDALAEARKEAATFRAKAALSDQFARLLTSLEKSGDMQRALDDGFIKIGAVNVHAWLGQYREVP